MKILIIGADGQVGKHIYSSALKNSNATVAGTYRNPQNNKIPDFLYLDLTKPETIKKVFESVTPDIVILCSAMTHVDSCEKYKEEAWKINVEGAGLVAEHCKTLNCRLVYFSTEYVFDGTAGPYSENDATKPISEYGRTKLEGENIVLALKDSLVIRTTVVYSYEKGSKNFLMQVLAKGGLKEKMNIVNDQYSNPTNAAELADFTLELIKLKKSGIYNVVGKDVMNRYEFVMKICEVFDIDKALIAPELTKNLNQMARRPLKAGLKTDKIFSELGKVPSGAESSLKTIKSRRKSAEKQ
ncbi:MAG: dTDP-4-dehydrorhamnose reductase [Elusimicrobiota bacterium]|nr:dTDP-4-dehydrorhamnose reductase [Elusimicrobiota bacterium]